MKDVVIDDLVDKRMKKIKLNALQNRTLALFQELAKSEETSANIEGSDDILASVDRTALYKTYVIQHTVPRFNNPSGVFDNDQYLYKIYVKCSDSALITSMDTFMGQIATWTAANGNNVPFQSSIDTLS